MLKTPSETYIEMNMPGGVIILKKYGIELAMACLLLLSFYILSREAAQTAGNMSRSESSQVILVDAGHGGADPGMIGVGGLEEKGINLEIALKLKKVLANIEMLTKIEGHYPEDLLQSLANSQMVAEKELDMKGIGNVINHVSANVGLISGGTRPNMVPDYCEATIDCRLPYGVDHEEIENTVKEMIKTAGVEGVEYELLWKSEANVTRDDSDIVQAIKKNAEAIWGITVYPAWQWACSDAREYRLKGVPTIQYGPSNTEGIHAPNENVDIEDVVNAGQIYVLSLCDLLGVK